MRSTSPQISGNYEPAPLRPHRLATGTACLRVPVQIALVVGHKQGWLSVLVLVLKPYCFDPPENVTIHASKSASTMCSR